MTNIKRAILAISIAVFGILGLTTGIASAHNGSVTAACVDGTPKATANLTNYNGTNAITIKNNGAELTPGTFGSSYQHTFDLGDPYIVHTVVYKVTAHDDVNNAQGFSPGGTITVPACKTNPPKPEVKVTYTEWVSGTPVCGQGTVTQTRIKTVTDWTLVNHVWVAGTPVSTTETRTVEVAITPCPTVPPTTTTPPTTVPPTTVPPTTVPPTTVTPTTTPTPCAYDVSIPADSPNCVPPVVTTVAPPTTPSPVPDQPVLPATGKDQSGGTLFASILVGAGIIALLVARRPKHA